MKKELFKNKIEELLTRAVKLQEIETDKSKEYWSGQVNILKVLLSFIDSMEGESVRIWHDANQPPEINIPILVRTYDNIVESTKRYDDNLIPWEDRIKRDDITHWCYVEDLLKL